MIQSQVGFVLKRFYPNKSKITVLSMYEGKFDLSFKDFKKCCKLWPGMLISYSLDKKPSNFMGFDVKILTCPQIVSEQTIYFIHHILELCDFFIPDEKPCTEIFNLLKQIFLFFGDNIYPEKYFIFIQKIFIIKLLSLFGFFDFEPISRYLAIYDMLTTTFIDFTLEQKVEFLEKHLSQTQEKDLDEWICTSIKFHPGSSLLKTSSFIYKH